MRNFVRRARRFRPLPLLLLSFVLLGSLGFAQEGSQKWSFDTGSAVEGTPALSGEGIIYTGSFSDSLFALRPDGTEQWSFDTGDNIRTSPLVAPDGTIYVGNDEGQVFALSPEGNQKWMFDPGTSRAINGDMALGADGTLYAGVGRILHAILPNGNEFWSLEATGTIQGLVIGIDGKIYVSQSGDNFQAVDPDGSVAWAFNTDRTTGFPAAIADDGTIYVGTNSDDNVNFYAINPDGTEKWSVNLGSIVQSPVIGADGSIYVPITGGFDPPGFLLKLDPEDGSEIWSFEAVGNVISSPAVGSDGVIYFGTSAERFFAVNPDGTERWVFETQADNESSPTIAPDGTIYFGSSDSNLYALRSSSQGLAASAWPKRQGDVANTGQAGSDVSRRRWFAPQTFWLNDANQSVITARHFGGSTGSINGKPASFRVRLLNRDGTEEFVVEEMIDIGETKNVAIEPPGGGTFVGAAVVDAPRVDSQFLAFFLTWRIEVTAGNAFRVGAFFSKPDEAALVHHFPAETSPQTGLGIAMQNIGGNEISCTLEFFNPDGSLQVTENLDMDPLGSIVQFFDGSLPGTFNGGATLACDAPVVAVAVTQEASGFPTDRLTAKGGTQ